MSLSLSHIHLIYHKPWALFEMRILNCWKKDGWLQFWETSYIHLGNCINSKVLITEYLFHSVLVIWKIGALCVSSLVRFWSPAQCFSCCIQELAFVVAYSQYWTWSWHFQLGLLKIHLCSRFSWGELHGILSKLHPSSWKTQVLDVWFLLFQSADSLFHKIWAMINT